MCYAAPPPALHNVWVKPSTILANILWEVADTGGYPIIDFTAEYRLKPAVGEEPEEWKPIIPMHIPPNSVNIPIYLIAKRKAGMENANVLYNAL